MMSALLPSGNDRVLVGRKLIARRFGCSVRTVDRVVARGELVVFKTGPANSPIRARVSEINRTIAKLEGRC